jgi:hypothetical protein
MAGMELDSECAATLAGALTRSAWLDQLEVPSFQDDYASQVFFDSLVERSSVEGNSPLTLLWVDPSRHALESIARIQGLKKVSFFLI